MEKIDKKQNKASKTENSCNGMLNASNNSIEENVRGKSFACFGFDITLFECIKAALLTVRGFAIQDFGYSQ